MGFCSKTKGFMGCKQDDTSRPKSLSVEIPITGAERRSVASDSVSASHFLSTKPSAERHLTSPLQGSQLLTLLEQGYTNSLAQSLARTHQQDLAKRIWIVDNSGSMQNNDGCRMVENSTAMHGEMQACTRWEELSDCVEYHIRLAALLEAPAHFRYLNGPSGDSESAVHQYFSIADASDKPNSKNLEETMMAALTCLGQATPSGCTPLTAHLESIYLQVMSLNEQGKAFSGKIRRPENRVVVVLATDGFPTDPRGYGGHSAQEEFLKCLSRFRSLPVQFVFRLCTNKKDIVKFYQKLAQDLDFLEIVVLEDFQSESRKVRDSNPWLNYALPLHRMRESGYANPLLNVLSQRMLTSSEMRDFAELLFVHGTTGQQCSIPQPSTNWNSFWDETKRLLAKEKLARNPLEPYPKPWIHLNQLYREYHAKRRKNRDRSDKSSSCIVL
jgi:hypothetical protein